MKKEGFKLEEIEIEHFLQLMNIYLSEWDHRATALWNQVFKYFYATLIVLFLPNLANHLQINLSGFQEIIFPSAAFFLSFVFLHISLGCAKRAKDIGNIYKNLMKLLPEELRRVSELEEDVELRKFFYDRMSYVICWLMFFVLACLSGIMIAHYKGFI